MAQELEQIVATLREMNRANNSNNDNFEALLANINSKLNMVDNNSKTVDLLNAYISELTRETVEKSSVTATHLTEIDKAIQIISNDLDEHVNKNFKKAYNSFVANLEKFQNETKKQKEFIETINERIAEITANQSNKKYIQRLFNQIKADLKKLNHAYKNTLDSVSSDLKSILTNITKLEQSLITDRTKDQISVLSKEIEEISSCLTSVEKRDISLEQLLSNVATSESLKVTQSIISVIIDKSEKLLATVNELSNNAEIEPENSTKELISKITKKADSLANLTDNINQTLAKVSKDIDALPNTADLENNLKILFKKIDELASDINSIDVQVDLLNVDHKLSELNEELTTIKNIIGDLNEVVTLKVLTSINDLSFENECSEIKDQVSNILTTLPQPEDIEKILEYKKSTKQVVEAFINQAEINTEEDCSTVDNTEDEIESMIDNLNFNDEFANIYDKTASIENWLITSNLKENTEAIASKMDSKAEQKDMLTVLNTVENIVDGIDKLSKSFGSANSSKTNSTEIKNAISEVKEILENNRSKFSEVEQENLETFQAIESYLKEIKVILDTSDKDLSEDVKSRLENIENCINNYKLANNNTITALIAKLDEYQEKLEEESSTGDLTPSLAEISEIKAQIDTLSKSFATLDLGNPEQANSSAFVSEILNELGSNLEELSCNIDDKLQHGFVYNAELIEEKTATIINFIRELKNSNEQGTPLYNQLDEADNKLNDYKQELEFINTDVISTLNSQSEQLLRELEPIKEMLANLANVPVAKAEVKESLTGLHESVFEDLVECTKYSKSTYDKLEDSYEKISRELTDTENNLKDFILGDIDSVIIKIDSLRSDLEDSLNRISPPDAEQMAEFKKFVEQIAQFKGDPALLVAEATQEITQNLNESLAQQHEEIKSMLSVSINNEEIIAAIEDLKNCFYSKVELLSEIKQNQINQDDELLADFEANQFEQAFEVNKNEEVISELRADFDKFSDLVKDLADENSEICEVLNVIKNKMETISVVKAEEVIPNSDDNVENNEIIVGTGNFDFVKALDLLKLDIQNLHEDIAKILPKEEQKKASAAINSFPSISFGGADNKLLTALSEKIDLMCETIKPKEWLEDIQTYIGGDIIQALLDEINGKVDILTLADNSEILNEIKEAISQIPVGETSVTSDPEIQKMLSLINEKVDILASNNDYELLEDVRDAIDRLDFASTDNSGTEKLLNTISSKIDVIAATDNSETEELLNTISSKIDVIAATDNLGEFEEIKDTLSESDAKITSMLEELGDKIESLSNQDNAATQQELEEVKSLIQAQTEYLEKLEQNEKTEAVKDCLDKLIEEVNNINSTEGSVLVQATLREMKESIMAAIVTVFEQISFIEESEDIKDFVEEKTDEINQNLANVTNQLKQITSSEEASDYVYSMQDIESDLAKLRLALSNLQESEEETQTQRLSSILENINTISLSVDELQNSITKDDELRDKFERVTTDINSLSVLTNQLIISSGESYNALSSSFEGFGKLITDKLTTKVDNVTKLLETSHASDKVMRQALIYMGEWIDSASESMNKISTNSEEIVDIKSALDSLKKSVPEQTDILNSIEEKFDEQQERLAYFEKQISKLGGLEDKFEAQQERIDRLEMSLERILTAVEDIDDSKVNRKIDKIDKQLAKLSTNIEKLASYVD